MTLVVPQLRQLRAALGGNIILLYSDHLFDTALPILYRCLERMGRQDTLNLLLFSSGGEVVAAHRMMALIRQYAGTVNVLVPWTCVSAGTLLCLGADQIIAGPMASFGPVDPHIAMGGQTGLVNAQEVKVMTTMLRDWFQTNTEDHRFQAFVALAQQYTPAALVASYRADQEVRALGLDLLKHHLPDQDERQRTDIISRLVDGYHSHGTLISRNDFRSLGLNVAFAEPCVERWMWEAVQHPYEHYLRAQQHIFANLILSEDFYAESVDVKPEILTQWAANRGVWKVSV